MNSSSLPTSQEMPATAQAARQDLLEMFAAYTEVTHRLQESHERLQGEVSRLRDELAAKNRELRRRERLASLGQMAAGLAHEIRNPLGAIALYASLLEQDLLEQPEPLHTVRKVATAVDGLNRLVTSILEFARPREPSRLAVSFRRVLAPALATVAPMIEQKAIQLRLPQREATVFADAEDLSRALANLLRNAAEAVGTGGRIAVRIRGAGNGAAVIRVEDDGPGIAPEMVESLFEPFATTKHNGTGLGLAIVHQTIEAHGGRIRVGRSRLGGARFAVRIGRQTGGANMRPAGMAEVVHG
jgi:signal transduction histidine kinase